MAENVSILKDAMKKNPGDSTVQRDVNGGDPHAKHAKSKKNYKLLIDPAIKKGHQKIYRFDGIFPGQPAVIPRDPRPPRAKLWTATVAELPIPPFKVDKHYVGSLPENTVRFGCLNDNINRQFLRELCSKFGKIEECKVYYDIKSKKHLGTGKITFSTSSSARQAVSELDGSSVMGNIIRVTIDRKKNRNPSYDKPVSHGSKDPREFRDPRRSISTGSCNAVLPTPSPSQYSPSVESTPPTPLVSAMYRSHPVANIKHTSYQRRNASLDTDFTPLESPASICSASFNSSTFEPISPPAVPRMRSSSSDNSSFPPPPPPDKTSNLPPPPPPAKQEIYEDISPTANFDDESKSPVSEMNKNNRHELITEKDKDAFVHSHLLGLKIACGVDTTGVKQIVRKDSEENKREESKYHYNHHNRSRSPVKDKGIYKQSIKDVNRTENSFRTDKNDKTLDGSSHQTLSLKRVGYGAAETKNDLQVNERNNKDEKSINLDVGGCKNDSVYEEISDSDEESNKTAINKDIHVEDISPVNSPLLKNPLNGEMKMRELQKSESDIAQTFNDTDKCKMDIENNDADDDDDDAMSLSSISSNEEVSLVLNTPAIPVATVSSSHFRPFSSQAPVFVNTRPTLSMHPRHPTNIVAPPPVNMAAPPPVNVAPPPVNVAPPPVNVAPPPVNVAPPAPINIQSVNVHQPPLNVQQNTVIARLPPPPPVNIHVPPPGMTFNQNIPPPPYGHRTGQPPQMRPSQAPPSSYPPKSTTGGFLGSYSRPYSGFFSGNYPNYQEFDLNKGRPVNEVIKKVPFEEKVKKSCILKTKKDLKAVLHRDLIKRLVEHSGFSALEAWWDNQTKKKDSNTATSRLAALPHSSGPSLNIPHSESPSSSTTSSLLMSLFGRAQPSSSSSNMSSPTRILGPVSKIPSFRINRIPQARPIGRESVSRMMKRSGKTSVYDVPNKYRKLSTEEDDEERTVKEEETDSESDSEAERRLLANRRPTVKSGSSLYQTIYESSESEESEDDDKSVESEEESDDDDDDKFQDLIIQQQKLKKEQMRRREEEQRLKKKEEEMEEEMDEELEEEDKDEMSVQDEDEERSSEDDEEFEEVDVAGVQEEEESDSEWESSGAEEAVQEIIKETEKRLEKFKEKSLKKEEQERKKIEHDKLVNRYLNRAKESYSQDGRRVHVPERIIEERGYITETNAAILDSKPHRELMSVDSKNKIVSKEDIKMLHKHRKGKENEAINKVVEETIEETEISAKLSDITTEVKEELISEEIIEIEREEEEEEEEGEVFNEHSYASTISMEKEVLNRISDKPESPVVIVDVDDDKDLLLEKIEPKPVFPMRSIDDEKYIIWNILREGIDKEDLEYLKSAFESLHGCGSDVVKDHHWSHHPETLIPTRQKRFKGEPLLRTHKTGCARSEGYYKIEISEKAQYLSSVMRELETTDENQEKESDGLKHKQQSRENRAMQRRLVSSFVNDDFGDLVKFNMLKSRKKKLKFSKSGIHNWGLFTCEPIAAEEMVIEYVGEKVRSVIADAREKNYEQRGIGSSYMFRLDAETVIDATKVGNNARFINHSCTPNCYAKIINVENEKKIVIYSKFDIKMNDEITYDYKFPIEEVKIKCLCGTPQCRGTLN